jgi:SWI/SNF-related matrix-associated actin-dependent regulator 1 of chromatin subfamily A
MVDRSISVTGEVRTPYDPAALPILRSAPGARWVPDRKCWSWSVSDTDLPRTLECARKLGLDVPPELEKRALAGTAETRAAVERVAEIESRSGRKLYPFQRTGVEFLARKDRALLADDMGLGKTVQVLAALPFGARVVVVCPASLKLNWAAECRRWRPDLVPLVLAGRGAWKWPESGEIVIVNYDILPVSIPAGGTGVILAVDESHSVKDPKAQRSKKIKSLAARVAQVWFLTGTPMLNRPKDLWGVLDALGSRPLGGWLSFCRLFNAQQEQVATRWDQARGCRVPVLVWVFGSPAPEVAERLRRVMLRRRKEEVLPDLPRKQRTEHWVDTSRATQKQLDELLGDYSDELEDDCLPPFSAFSTLLAELAVERIPAMLELVESYEEQDTPLIVFSAHRAPIDELSRREGWAVITGDSKAADRQQAVEDLQGGKLRGLGCTIQAGGVGLTLTRASHVLFVDRDWTPALNLQAEDRVCRIGQTASSIQVITMRSDHILCRHLDRLLDRKQSMIEAAVEREQGALSAEHIGAVDARERAAKTSKAAVREARG